MAHWLSLSSSQHFEPDDGDDDCCFSWLLKDLVLMILTHLEVADGIACFKSCKLFWQLSRSRVLWEHLYENTYGSDFVRKEFMKQFENHEMFTLGDPAQWTVGESSKVVEVPYAEFPHIPYRTLAIAFGTPAGNPRVREASAEGDDATEEDTEVLSVYEKSDLNIKYGLARLKNEHQSFSGVWYNGDICLGLYATVNAEGEESFVYGGMLKNRRGNGMGITVFPSGGHYIGDFVSGELDGEGFLSYREGDTYQGSWKRNVKNGYGVYKWVSGNEYAGNWVENRREGADGELRWCNGDTYIGDWLDNKRTGKGTLRWSPARGGGCYEGGFIDNQLHGWGRFTFRGIRYDGNWVADRREGEGRLTWDADNDYYCGIWKQGARTGKGILYLHTGEEIEQEWHEPFDIKYSQVTPLKFPLEKKEKETAQKIQ